VSGGKHCKLPSGIQGWAPTVYCIRRR